MQRPGKLTAVAILQICSGLIQFPLSCAAALMVSSVVGTVCAVLTAWIGGIGFCAGLVGYLSFALIPLGLVEIVSGILLLSGVRSPTLLKITSVLEILGLFVGGIPGALVGVLDLVLLSDDDAKAYLTMDQGSGR